MDQKYVKKFVIDHERLAETRARSFNVFKHSSPASRWNLDRHLLRSAKPEIDDLIQLWNPAVLYLRLAI